MPFEQHGVAHRIQEQHYSSSNNNHHDSSRNQGNTARNRFNPNEHMHDRHQDASNIIDHLQTTRDITQYITVNQQNFSQQSYESLDSVVLYTCLHTPVVFPNLPFDKIMQMYYTSAFTNARALSFDIESRFDLLYDNIKSEYIDGQFQKSRQNVDNILRPIYLTSQHTGQNISIKSIGRRFDLYGIRYVLKKEQIYNPNKNKFISYIFEIENSSWLMVNFVSEYNTLKRPPNKYKQGSPEEKKIYDDWINRKQYFAPIFQSYFFFNGISGDDIVIDPPAIQKMRDNRLKKNKQNKLIETTPSLQEQTYRNKKQYAPAIDYGEYMDKVIQFWHEKNEMYTKKDSPTVGCHETFETLQRDIYKKYSITTSSDTRSIPSSFDNINANVNNDDMQNPSNMKKRLIPISIGITRIGEMVDTFKQIQRCLGSEGHDKWEQYQLEFFSQILCVFLPLILGKETSAYMETIISAFKWEKSKTSVWIVMPRGHGKSEVMTACILICMLYVPNFTACLYATTLQIADNMLEKAYAMVQGLIKNNVIKCDVKLKNGWLLIGINDELVWARSVAVCILCYICICSFVHKKGIYI